jgi:hypothetical protein
MNNFLNNKKALKGFAVALVLIVAISVLLATWNGGKEPLDPSLVMYENEQYGFSFAYPRSAELVTELQSPQLAQVVLQEGYSDTNGDPQHYTIEVTLGQVLEYRPYVKEISNGTDTFTISLKGPASDEVPKNVKEALMAVRDSFEL